MQWREDCKYYLIFQHPNCFTKRVRTDDVRLLHPEKKLMICNLLLDGMHSD